MNRDEILQYAQELLDSLNDLPSFQTDGYSAQWNEGYRTAVLEIVRDLNRRVVRMDEDAKETSVHA